MKQSLLLKPNSQRLNRKSFIKVLLKALPIVLLLSLLGLLWGYADNLKLLLETKAVATPVSCDLQRQLECEFDTTLGNIQLSVDRKIQSLEPFKLSILSDNPQWQRAEIRFEGFYDYMGINKFDFAVDSQNSHLWSVKGSIPICTTEAKTWRVLINLFAKDSTTANNQVPSSSYWFKIKTN
jgi:hypothetical protein